MSIRAVKLSWFLMATGIATLAILLQPGVVLIGFLLLIIPGLFLSIAPAAFAYGCTFAAFRLGLQAWLDAGGRHAAPIVTNGVALAGAAAVGVTLGLLSQIEARARLAAFALAPVQSAGKIPVRGDVRLEMEHFGGRGCDAECKALLQHPGVTSVMIHWPPLNDFAALRDGRIDLAGGARYRLGDAAECHGAELEHDAVADRCLIALPLLARYDLLVRRGVWKEWAAPWSYWGLRRPVEADFAEVRTSERVLARAWHAKTQALAVPLLALPTCGGVWETELCWSRRALGQWSQGSAPGALDLLDL